MIFSFLRISVLQNYMKSLQNHIDVFETSSSLYNLRVKVNLEEKINVRNLL
jgi:hypothetical protein